MAYSPRRLPRNVDGSGQASLRPELRTGLLQIRCQAGELERWRAKASGLGVNLSQLIRSALDGVAVPRSRRSSRVETDPVLLRQLALIGNNLNQLARWANRDHGGVPAVAVVARLIEIDRELAGLRADLSGSGISVSGAPAMESRAPTPHASSSSGLAIGGTADAD